MVTENRRSTVFWPYFSESAGLSGSSQMERNVSSASMAAAISSTFCGSARLTSMEAGSGFVPSSCSMISGLVVMELLKFSSACSLVVKPTLSTPSMPWIIAVTASMDSGGASSAT